MKTPYQLNKKKTMYREMNQLKALRLNNQRIKKKKSQKKILNSSIWGPKVKSSWIKILKSSVNQEQLFSMSELKETWRIRLGKISESERWKAYPDNFVKLNYQKPKGESDQKSLQQTTGKIHTASSKHQGVFPRSTVGQQKKQRRELLRSQCVNRRQNAIHLTKCHVKWRNVFNRTRLS